MPTITVKNIPPEVYTRLREAAKANHRSINSEIIACIEKAVTSRPFDPSTFLNRARQLREKTAEYVVTDEEFIQAKNSGRS
jgi:plasmid stability protein